MDQQKAEVVLNLTGKCKKAEEERKKQKVLVNYEYMVGNKILNEKNVACTDNAI
jgi:hypothetical protein